MEENFDLLKDPSIGTNSRRYLQQQYDQWNGLDDLIFKRYNLRSVLYQETIIISPEYRHKGLSTSLMRYTAKTLAGKCDAVLSDSLFPMDLYEKLIADSPREKPLPGSITLRSLVTYDDFFVTIELLMPDYRRRFLGDGKDGEPVNHQESGGKNKSKL